MTIDIGAIENEIAKQHAEAIAKKAGAHIPADLAAVIRSQYRSGVSITVIRASLRKLGIRISQAKCASVAKTRNPRKTVSQELRGASEQNPAPTKGQSGVINQMPAGTEAVVSRASDVGTPEVKTLEALTKANSQPRYFKNQ